MLKKLAKEGCFWAIVKKKPDHIYSKCNSRLILAKSRTIALFPSEENTAGKEETTYGQFYGLP